MSRTKDYRRHQLRRIKEKVLKQERATSNRLGLSEEQIRIAEERSVFLRVNTRTLCSCYGCNNSEDVMGHAPKYLSFFQLLKTENDY